jgi:hypothetical protein
MIGPGGVVTNAAKGSLGVILNVREIARTANGDILTEYEAAEISPQNGTGAYSGIEGKRTRLVDASTLTAAQARDGGVSSAQYKEALEAANKNGAGGANDSAKTPAQMSDGERAELSRLQARDSAVKQEEKGHAAAAGQYASAPQYQYAIGPDGKAYAIGGHVDVSISSQGGTGKDNKAALAALQNAALSPNAPSGADMAAFRQATMLLGMQNQKNDATSNVTALNDSASNVTQTDTSLAQILIDTTIQDPASAQARRDTALSAYDATNRQFEENENESAFALSADGSAEKRHQRGSIFNSNA